MSGYVSEWFRQEWVGGVNHLYQNKGFTLRKCCKEGKLTSASKGYWRFAGKGTATKMRQGGIPSDVSPMNAGRTKVEVDIEHYQAAEYIHEIDLDKMELDERQEAQDSAAMALGRQHDTVIMTAVDGGGGLHGPVIGDYVSGFTLLKMQEMVRQLQARDVPWDSQVFCPLPASVWNQAIGYPAFSNSQCTDEKTLDRGVTGKFWNGVHWFLGYESLFPTDGGVGRRFYMWHQSAVGQLNNKELQSRITWENTKTAWLSNNWMGMAAKVLQGGTAGGIIEGRVKNDAALV